MLQQVCADVQREVAGHLDACSLAMLACAQRGAQTPDVTFAALYERVCKLTSAYGPITVALRSVGESETVIYIIKCSREHQGSGEYQPNGEYQGTSVQQLVAVPGQPPTANHNEWQGQPGASDLEGMYAFAAEAGAGDALLFSLLIEDNAGRSMTLHEALPRVGGELRAFANRFVPRLKAALSAFAGPVLPASMADLALAFSMSAQYGTYMEAFTAYGTLQLVGQASGGVHLHFANACGVLCEEFDARDMGGHRSGMLLSEALALAFGMLGHAVEGSLNVCNHWALPASIGDCAGQVCKALMCSTLTDLGAATQAHWPTIRRKGLMFCDMRAGVAMLMPVVFVLI